MTALPSVDKKDYRTFGSRAVIFFLFLIAKIAEKCDKNSYKHKQILQGYIHICCPPFVCIEGSKKIIAPPFKVLRRELPPPLGSLRGLLTCAVLYHVRAELSSGCQAVVKVVFARR